MSSVIPPEYDEIISSAYYVWFTTVRPDGMPTPTPVWFVRDGDSFVIYTTPGSQKLKFLQANFHVSLAFTPDADGGNYFVVLGTAQVDQTVPLAINNPSYMTKYGDGLAATGMTAESLSDAYNVPIRVTPIRIRGMEDY
ncbi:MAG: pyridoxamine 5'-phosphate oxidase family protein [Anaerolineae bacterium]|nr:pyridoxamine 5'-phosphate oxidase family protein [Anaerolineae bacterium]